MTAASDLVLALPSPLAVGRDVRPEMVRGLNLDVCVVLSNVTYGWNEYICFAAHRLGRLQAVNYCSPITVGFQSIDRVIVSEMLAASSALETQYLEQPAFLAGGEICFPSWVREPVTAARSEPRHDDRELVFVSGASMFKISVSCRRAWVEILTRLPEACLILCPFNPNWGKVSPGAFTFCRVLKEECAAAGVDPARISIEGPWSDRDRIYDVLSRCDVYLDSFPHSGGLSTIDAIRMGLPFVTLTSANQREQQSAALARDLKCEELISQSWEEYVGLACELALILQVRRWRRFESVVPRSCDILVDILVESRLGVRTSMRRPPCTFAARPRPDAPICRSSRAAARATRFASR